MANTRTQDFAALFGPTGEFTREQGILTGTANGTITIGKAVVINDDETISQLIGLNPATGNSLAESQIAGTLQSIFDGTMAGTLSRYLIVPDPRSTTNAMIVYSSEESNDLRIRSIWVDPNNPSVINIGVPTNIAGTSQEGRDVGLVWHDANSVFITLSFLGTDVLHARTANISAGNTVNTSTVVTQVSGIHDFTYTLATTSTSNTGAFAAFYDSTNQKTIVGCFDSTTVYPQALVANCNVFAVGVGTPGVIESVAAATTSQFPKIYGCHDSLNNKNIFLYSGKSLSTMNVVVGTVTGTTITFGTPVQVPFANAQLNYGITFDSIRNKTVIAASNLIYEYTVSETTPVLEGTFIPEWSTGQYSDGGCRDLRYNPNTKNFTVFTEGRSVGSINPSPKVFKKNNISNTYTILQSYDPLNPGRNFNFSGSFSQIGNSNNYISISNQLDRSGCGPLYGTAYTVRTIPFTNDKGDASFFGFSRGTYTNGQTASIAYVNGGGTIINDTVNYISGGNYSIDWTNQAFESSGNTTNQYKTFGFAIANNKLIVS